MKKELVVEIHDQFRNSDQANPLFSYEFEGFVYDDNESSLNQGIFVSTTIGDGNSSHPSPEGLYPIVGSGILADNYFITYLNGILTVSDKTQQQLVFDQNLSEISATLSTIQMTGYSRKLDGNLTSLPLVYEVEDEAIARIRTTRQDLLTAYWKLDESLYAAAQDSTGNYNGTVLDLNTTGETKVGL